MSPGLGAALGVICLAVMLGAMGMACLAVMAALDWAMGKLRRNRRRPLWRASIYPDHFWRRLGCKTTTQKGDAR